MSNFSAQLKKYSVMTLVVVNIAAVGAIAGAYAMHSYDNGTATAQAKAVQSAITASSSAQAASPKVNSR